MASGFPKPEPNATNNNTSINDLIDLQTLLSSQMAQLQTQHQHQLQTLRREKQLAEEKNSVLLFEKITLGTELGSYKRKCAELKESVARLTERERKGLLEGEKKISDLKKKNCELECGKLMAEKEVEASNSRFEELYTRLVRLEDDVAYLSKLEQPFESNNGGVSGHGNEDIDMDDAGDAGRSSATVIEISDDDCNYENADESAT